MISSLTIVSRRGLGLQYTRFLSTSYTSKANQVALSLSAEKALPSPRSRHGGAQPSKALHESEVLDCIRDDRILHQTKYVINKRASAGDRQQLGGGIMMATTWKKKKRCKRECIPFTLLFFCPPPMECCASIEREPVFNCPVLS